MLDTRRSELLTMSDHPEDFNPNSINATLSRIMAAQDEMCRKADRIIAQVEQTNGRVSKLETWKAIVGAQTAIVSTAVAGSIGVLGWIVNYMSKKP